MTPYWRIILANYTADEIYAYRLWADTMADLSGVSARPYDHEEES